MSTLLDVTSSLDAANVNLGRKPKLLFRSCGESRQTARPEMSSWAGVRRLAWAALPGPHCVGRIVWAALCGEDP
jgi:hypothetical protein